MQSTQRSYLIGLSKLPNSVRKYITMIAASCIIMYIPHSYVPNCFLANCQSMHVNWAVLLTCHTPPEGGCEK